MERISTFFLRGAIGIVALITLAICIFGLPAVWGAAHDEYAYGSNSLAVYGVVIALYLASGPFFVGLYQALRLLGFIDRHVVFSKASTKSLQVIMYCAAIICAIFAFSLPFFYAWSQLVDAPGLMGIGMFFAGASLTVAVFAAVLSRLFLEAARIKSENDLTV